MGKYEFPTIIGILLLCDYYEHKKYKKIHDTNLKLTDDLKEYKKYKEFVINKKLSEEYKKYEMDVDTYDHFKAVGGIKYKENVKNKYYIVDPLFGEKEFDLPHEIE